MQTKIAKQAQSLNDMAGVFENAEKENVQKSGELKKDDFV
jgi:hypothetical protein